MSKKRILKADSRRVSEISTDNIRAYFGKRKIEVRTLGFGTYNLNPKFDNSYVISLCGNGQKICETIYRLGMQNEDWREDIRKGNLYIRNIEIPSNLVALQSGISNRHSRTKGNTINGNVYTEILGRKK